MATEIDITVPAGIASSEQLLLPYLRQHTPLRISSYRILRRSIDARQQEIKYNLRVQLFHDGETPDDLYLPRSFEVRPNSPTVVIMGAGPAGLFAGLRLAELGIRPVIIDRGKDVQARRRDLAAIHKNHIVNPDSNYCFGEGGAGTYSDGKLYTRSTKRGDVRRVLETLVQFGAAEDILVEAHPHIGTNKLPRIIAAMREEVIKAGGEVHFNKRWSGMELQENRIRAIELSDGSTMQADAFIMATGHSARDVFTMLHLLHIEIEFKPFALGVRAEHPQAMVDRSRYRRTTRPEYLPPASYSLVHQVDGRGVYSFCMCPGGIIAPCATVQDEVVTNGWSPSKRNNPWANSGIVVPVEWEDLKAFHHHGPLAGMHFQREIEHRCWQAAGSTQAAPAQRLVDFVLSRKSETLPECSYQPGLVSCNLAELLPGFIADRLRKGFKAFDQKMPGYLSPDAILVAPESRTSSPVRVPRDTEKLHHPQLQNFYPCGEGAGYAGGIVSAAIDGEKVATMLASVL